jgi:hypothetical protein
MATRRYHEPRQRERSPLWNPIAIRGPDMVAVYIIGAFVLAFFALNFIDFGRID